MTVDELVNAFAASVASELHTLLSTIDGLPSILPGPAISGTPRVGQTLTAIPGTWTNSPTSFSYQWRAGGADIPGATGATYVPVAGDIGAVLAFQVIAHNAIGDSKPVTSPPTAAVIA